MEMLKEKEEILRFLQVDEYPSGDGDGFGDSDGFGSEFGSGNGYGYGSGFGFGTGHGYGNGYGNGYDFGDGSGFSVNNDFEYDNNIEYFNLQKVYNIDNIKTLIDSVHGNFAKGHILYSDLTTKPCFIAKSGNFFAHGDTLKQAIFDVREKYVENIPIEERIAQFNKEYPDRNIKIPASELFSWHHILTGSCLMGRKQFCEEHNLDYVNGEYSVNEFISLTRNAYGSNIIKLLESSS